MCSNGGSWRRQTPPGRTAATRPTRPTRQQTSCVLLVSHRLDGDSCGFGGEPGNPERRAPSCAGKERGRYPQNTRDANRGRLGLSCRGWSQERKGTRAAGRRSRTASPTASAPCSRWPASSFSPSLRAGGARSRHWSAASSSAPPSCCSTRRPRSTTPSGTCTPARGRCSGARPLGDLPAHRRHLHALHAREPAGSLGLVALRRRVGASRSPGSRSALRCGVGRPGSSSRSTWRWAGASWWR